MYVVMNIDIYVYKIRLSVQSELCVKDFCYHTMDIIIHIDIEDMTFTIK